MSAYFVDGYLYFQAHFPNCSNMLILFCMDTFRDNKIGLYGLENAFSSLQMPTPGEKIIYLEYDFQNIIESQNSNICLPNQRTWESLTCHSCIREVPEIMFTFFHISSDIGVRIDHIVIIIIMATMIATKAAFHD